MKVEPTRRRLRASWCSRALLVTSFLAAAILPKTAVAQDDALTLDRAISLALSGNRSLANAGLDVRKAERDLAAARTLRLPSVSVGLQGQILLSPLDFTFERGVFGTYPEIGPVPGTDTTITTPRRPTYLLQAQLGQPLSQQYRIGLGIDLREISRQIAEERLRGERHRLRAEVTRAFFDVAHVQAAAAAAGEALRLNRELDRLAAEFLKKETILRHERLDLGARLARAEADELAVRNSLDSAKERLNLLLGRPLGTSLRVEEVPIDESDDHGIDGNAVSDGPAERRPELREARLRVRQAELDLSMKKAEAIPDVNFFVTYFSPINVELIPRHIAAAGLQIKWEGFDWGRRRQESAEKALVLEQAMTGLRETEAQTALDLNVRRRKVAETAKGLVAARLAREAAVERLRVVSDRFGKEAALLRDVLQAEAALSDARRQAIEAYGAHQAARAELRKALGED